MRVIAPPPSRFPGNQIYVDRDDAVQPLVDQLKAQGPLDKDDQLMLQGLARLRIEAMMREAYHNQAVVVENAIAEFPRLDRYRKLKEAGERKRRAMREQREKALLEKQAEERRAKERLEALHAAALKRDMERRRRERQLLEEERRRKLAEAEEQRRRQKAEAEARRRREREEAERLAELERLRELHIRRLREMEEQKRKEAEMRRRWEELQRERERQMKEEQERAAREAEEAARRAREEQERAAREEQERAAREEQERLAQEKERLAQEDANMHLRQICDLYERKWTELKTNRELQNIVSFFEFPFPVFTYSCTSPSDITYERVREFLFHPFRPSIEGKSRKEILKVEVLRWHPDKFDTLIFPKMRDGEWEATKEAAGLVARWVTRLMAEE
ncbi:hypothetical protein BN946_scf184573.g9 [Trametes cinnabarina]|uniref:Uncharacterized protein n=1 Tax=Pycnoporus cinnabarinus TaxID=5643 RepID=A0A060S8G9_PYCCI|nr:hypothetical protein BN946_scf184573.g9 [Trametes cinnabarina]